MSIAEVVATLRRQGSDTAACEAKRAQGGFPENVAETLSAFSNTPGGGDLVFGLDEGRGFAAVGVYDVSACQQAVASVGRDALRPPIVTTSEMVPFEGHDLVVVHVPEVDPQLKPVRVKRTNRAYLRQYDGDYPMSEFEEYAFEAQRGQPTFDEEPVAKATVADLDRLAVADYLARRREGSRALAGMDDAEALWRTGVVDEDGRPSLAGLLALGVYPQQYFPNSAIQASLVPGPQVDPAVRVLDSALFAGSIPVMLEDVLAWVQRVTAQAIGEGPNGTVVDLPQYPPVVVRELIANALIHRDLGPHARSTPITVRVEPDQLVVSNPGGLLGLRVQSLGHTPSHQRNARLTELLQFVKTPGGGRVVERLGTGIPIVMKTLAREGMAPAQFQDLGIRFTVRVAGRGLGQVARPSGQPRSPSSSSDGVNRNQAAILSALVGRSGTARDIASATGLTIRQVRLALAALDREGRIRRRPVNGRTMEYAPA
jgi:ATP-dependent DNA helicase RecG